MNTRPGHRESQARSQLSHKWRWLRARRGAPSSLTLDTGPDVTVEQGTESALHSESARAACALAAECALDGALIHAL